MFTAALLNAQPMGFYAPAQLVRDAREHGVEVRAADVGASDWDCTLERAGDGGWALRLGLRQIDGFGEVAAARLVEGRLSSPSPLRGGGQSGPGFADFDDLVRRVRPQRPRSCRPWPRPTPCARSAWTDARPCGGVRGLSAAPPSPLLSDLPDGEAPVALPHMGAQ